MAGNEILYTSKDENFNQFAVQIGNKCQFNLIPSPSPGEILKQSSVDSVSASLIELSSSGEIDDFLAQFKKCNSVTLKRKIHLVIPIQMMELAEKILSMPCFSNLIAWKGHFDALDVDQIATLINATKNPAKIEIKELLEEKTHIEKIDLQAQPSKSVPVEKLKKYLIDRGHNEITVSHVLVALDELLMNALFDAPILAGIDMDQLKSDGFSRRNYCYPGVTAEFGADANYIGLTVNDGHGSLRMEEIWKTTFKAFSRKKLMISDDSESGGAGVGLALIIKNGGRLFFNVNKGKWTSASVLFRLGRSQRQLSNQLQFIAVRDF